MDSIIQELLTNSLQAAKSDLLSLLKGQLELDDLILNLKSQMTSDLKAFVEAELAYADDLLVKQSKRQGWQIHDRRQRQVSSPIGWLTISRRYYYQENKGYRSPLDQVLGIRPYQRLTTKAEAMVIERAAQVSYQMTIDTLPELGLTSKATVMRTLRRYQNYDLVEENKALPKATPDYLYVEADEGHLHKTLKNDSAKLAHLIVVHEGWRRVDGSHTQLVNRHTFSGMYNSRTEDFWYQVLDYLDVHYDLTQIKQIYVSGDGASWIKKGGEIIPHSIFILDRFHACQAIRRLGRLLEVPEGKIEQWVFKDQRQLLKDMIQERLDERCDEDDFEKYQSFVQEKRRYLFQNWTFIQNQKSDNFHGTNMEGQVSHTLASRMTSRPMCWSTVGGNVMAHWRAMLANHSSIYHELQRQQQASDRELSVTAVDGRVLRKMDRQDWDSGVVHARFINESSLFKQINHDN